MGIVVSKTNYAPLALTSAIIGFVSFAFTVATFLRIVWVNLETMSEAPHVVHGFLTNLRTEILEEQASIRVMRKEAKKYHRRIRREGGESYIGIELDDVTLKTMSDVMKHLAREFKEVEKPFLAPGAGGIDDWKKHRGKRRNSSVSPYYEHSAYQSPPEKGGSRPRSGGDHDRGRRGRDDRDEDDDDEKFWAQKMDYAKYSLRSRFIWIWKKPKAQQLFDTLSRVQTRRMARQIGGISYLIHEYGNKTCTTEETLQRIEERMNTIVGIRRVNG